MKLPTLLLAIVFALTSLPSRLPAASVEDGLIAGAKKEGALVLYLSTNLTDANGLVQLYKSKYPFVNVDMFRADNEKLLNRVLTESATNKFNGDAIMISSFEVRVLLQKSFYSAMSRHTLNIILKVSPTKTAIGPAFIRYLGSLPTTPS